MEVNTTLAACSTPDPLEDPAQITGWVSSDRTRGSIDILWSCCITILLCCWVSTFPNVPSLNDKWYHPLVDKINLACIGFLGPDYLLTIALGQFSSARRSVKMFRELVSQKEGREWTLVHGFFADMGGFLLASPDYPPFPVNAEQLHYLVANGHVDFPLLTKQDIKALSKTDSLSKFITLWQVFWFSVSELQRVKEGLPMTTFELTALSFSVTMIVTSLCWYAKPTISRPTMIYTKDGRTIEYIREVARNSTHPGLPSAWYRTPLDFVSPRRRFRVDIHWSYYAQLTYMVHVPLFSREITARPWDRLPSDAWLVIDKALLAPALVVVVAFSLSLIVAWDFHFPTEGEKIAWRVCSVYHAAFSLGLAAYYIYVCLRGDHAGRSMKASLSSPPPPGPDGAVQRRAETVGRSAVDIARPNKAFFRDVEAEAAAGDFCGRLEGVTRKSLNWLRRWRNISPDGDPDMEIGLHATFFPLVGTFLFIFCRLFFYVEDFVSIREQPAGVYRAVNKYVPFLG